MLQEHNISAQVEAAAVHCDNDPGTYSAEHGNLLRLFKGARYPVVQQPGIQELLTGEGYDLTPMDMMAAMAGEFAYISERLGGAHQVVIDRIAEQWLVVTQAVMNYAEFKLTPVQR